jgi:hypothetical protein
MMIEAWPFPEGDGNVTKALDTRHFVYLHDMGKQEGVTHAMRDVVAATEWVRQGMHGPDTGVSEGQTGY